MSKRTIAFIAAAVMALSLAACGETSGESKSDKSAVNSTAEIDAYRLPDGSDLTAIQVDMYTWNFSSGFNIEDISFDSLGVSVANGSVYSFSFYKNDGDSSSESSLQEKAVSYGYEKTSYEYSDQYTMNCGDVTIDRVTEDSLIVSRDYK